MDWELEKIKDFIRREQKKGYDLDTIKTSLSRAGFSGNSISKAFATLNKMPKKEPGFLTKLFTPKKEKKKTELKPLPKEKPIIVKKQEIKKPITIEKKTGPSLFEKFFFKHEKKPAEPVKPTIPEKKESNLFEKMFAMSKPLVQPKKPEPVKIEIKKPEKPKGPSKIKQFTKKISQIHIPRPNIPIKKFFKKIFKKKPVVKKPEPVKKQSKPKIKFPKLHAPKIHLPKIHLPKIKLPKIPKVRGIFAIFFLIVFFVAVGIVVIMLPASCATENCFVKHANQCGQATYSNIIDGTTLKYETNNCILKKTVINMAKDEPQETVNEFQGKHMLCAFQQGDFSPMYLNTITGMLNTCEGDLKEAIQKHVI